MVDMSYFSGSNMRLLPPLPTVYWIDTSSICNLKCVMCPQSKGLRRPTSVMGMATFRRIIDHICVNQPLVKLYMNGEPLINKNIIEMIAYAAENGCRTLIHTNATLLDENTARRIIASPLETISFSFDGCTREVYERLRPPAKFESVKKNIEQFLKIKKEIGANFPKTIVEIIEMTDTEAYMDEFLEQWREAGVDETSVTPCMTWLGEIEDFRLNKPKIYGYRPCPALFKSMAISSDGTVVPCCMDVHNQLKLGNVNEQDIKDIWHGPEYQILRRQHLERRIPRNSICHECYNTLTTTRLEQIESSFPTAYPKLKEWAFYVRRIIENKAPEAINKIYRNTEKRVRKLLGKI